jgi:hypothetical protein
MLKDAIFEEYSLQLCSICFLGLACKLRICAVKNLCSNSVVGLGLYCCFDSCARIDTVCWSRSLSLKLRIQEHGVFALLHVFGTWGHSTQFLLLVCFSVLQFFLE